MKLRSVTGHTEDLKPVPPLDLPVIPGASALRSTANDLLIFLAANLGLTKSALAPAMAAMIRVRRPSGSEGVEVALGWHILTIDGRDIIWHNGGLGGCGSFMGYDLRHKVGVVVLSNSAVPAVADNIGFGLLSTSR